MTEIRGFPVTEAGTYVLLDDVIAAIREYAQAQDDPNAGALIHDLATWMGEGVPEGPERAPASDSPFDKPQMQQIGEVLEVHGAEPDDVTNGVARVEIFPDPPDDPRPKWYARTVDTSGFVLKTTNGSFDQEWVIQNAQERFPGVEIYLLRNAGEDSKWVEDSTRGVFPSKGPPVRRLWAGAGR